VCVCVCIYLCVYTYVYTHTSLCTTGVVQPIPLGVTFSKALSNQSSKLESLFSLKRCKRDVRALSFETAFENVTPTGIGSMMHDDSKRWRCVCVCVCVYMYVYVHTYIHTHHYAQEAKYDARRLEEMEVCVCVCVCKCMYVYIHMYTYIHTSLCTSSEV